MRSILRAAAGTTLCCGSALALQINSASVDALNRIKKITGLGEDAWRYC